MSSDVELLANAVRENLLSRGGCIRLVKRQKEVVFAGGFRADSVYFIEAGQVKLERKSRANSSLLLGIRGSDELIGEEAAFGDAMYDYSAIMLTSGAVWAIPSQSFADLCDERPQLWRMTATYMSTRKVEVERRIERIIVDNVRDRALGQLLELGRRMRTGDGAEATVPLSQSELASLIGATRETTSTVLNMLEREGLLRLGHRTVTLLPAATSEVGSPEALRIGASAGAR